MVDVVCGSHTVFSSQGTIELRDEEAKMHHVHKELLGVLLAVASRRAELRNKRVCLLVDSTTSVAYVTNWGGPSLVCNRIVRALWGVCARFGIRIVQISHIAGDKMISAGVDSLSRPYKFARGGESDRDDWRLSWDSFEWIQYVTQCVFTVDRMASRANRRCQQFCSISSVDPEAMGASAFSVDWNWDKEGNRAVNYCFPPFGLIPRVLQHLEECAAVCVMVVPNWPSQCWWVKLQRMLLYSWVCSKHGMFERVQDGDWVPVSNTSFQPLVCLVSGRKEKRGGEAE
jgi:hypothetical protein